MKKYRLKMIGVILFGMGLLSISMAFVPVDNRIKQDMIAKGTYRKGCPVSPERLVVVRFKYYNFEGVVQKDGEIIVLDAVAPKVEQIFKALYDLKFPIAKSRRIEFYNGNDALSLADNNTSGFSCRPIVGRSKVFSLHSYGVAIDINPVQNPYIAPDKENKGKVLVLPDQGLQYLNRAHLRPGMAEPVVDLFRKNGFTIWGGNWNNPIDWQHFQTPRIIAQILAGMKAEEARKFFYWYTLNSHLFDKLPDTKEKWIRLYQAA